MGRNIGSKRMKMWYKKGWDKDEIEELPDLMELRSKLKKRLIAYWNSFNTTRNYESFEELVDEAF
jgi:hypothetical protein